ncbi:MAG: DUF4290 domain-containing protein [Bacteroidaceae bacterium]|nr:DUF4290 domain-containing protein [Bacteroidaceae bacterium]
MNHEQHQLKLPEYGVLIHQLINMALDAPNRDERNKLAHIIVKVMKVIDANEDDNMGYRKYSPDYNAKLWDHLAFLSDYKLDIDYPVAITKVTPETYKSKPLTYPQKSIRYRHYGGLLQQLLQIACETTNKEAQNKIIKSAANRMKRNLADWKGDGICNEKVAADIAEYTNGVLQPQFKDKDLIRIDINHKLKSLNYT